MFELNQSNQIFKYKICDYSASLSIVTPFYSACLVETVQSNIASEKTAFYDVFKEGLIRLLQWNCPQKGKSNVYLIFS